MRLTTKNPNKTVKERGGEEGEEAGYVRAPGLAGLLLVQRGELGYWFDLTIGIGGGGVRLDGLSFRVSRGGLSFGSGRRGGGLEGQAFHAFGAGGVGGLHAFGPGAGGGAGSGSGASGSVVEASGSVPVEKKEEADST
jgi:hypothetical protein